MKTLLHMWIFWFSLESVFPCYSKREFHMHNLLSKLIPHLSRGEYVDSLGVLWEPLLYFQRPPQRLNYLLAFDFFLNCLFSWLHWVSSVAAHGLSCLVACGFSVAWPGIKPMSPALEGRFLTTGPPGKSSWLLILIAKDINSILVTNEWSFSV